MTDTNQASEDEPTKSKVDWSTPYDEWLIPILNRFRHGGAIECRAIPSEIQLNIESLIRTEKLKLLAEVRAGEKLSAYPLRETGSGVLEPVHEYAIPVSSLNKLEAEL